MTKTAVVLFNLGGPDSLTAVRPFLFNLFNDPAIIRLPRPLRLLIAWLISSRRDKTAQGIYAKMGGRSPILENTLAQAQVLERSLSNDGTIKCFVAMRYWHPFTDITVQQVEAFAPDQIILLPLYPQYSTTTTASSAAEWHKLSAQAGLNAPAKMICCYPDEAGFVDSVVALIRPVYEQALKHGCPRVLLSAHGLPEKIVRSGDPYQWQCERTAAAIIAALAIDDLDAVLCYQSRVGPMQWITPATDAEVRRAGQDKVPLVVVPIAFVSEHSETLVELDSEYRHLAQEQHVPFYGYVPTVSVMPDFIAGLAALVRQTMDSPRLCRSNRTERICPHQFFLLPAARTWEIITLLVINFVL